MHKGKRCHCAQQAIEKCVPRSRSKNFCMISRRICAPCRKGNAVSSAERLMCWRAIQRVTTQPRPPAHPVRERQLVRLMIDVCVNAYRAPPGRVVIQMPQDRAQLSLRNIIRKGIHPNRHITHSRSPAQRHRAGLFQCSLRNPQKTASTLEERENQASSITRVLPHASFPCCLSEFGLPVPHPAFFGLRGSTSGSFGVPSFAGERWWPLPVSLLCLVVRLGRLCRGRCGSRRPRHSRRRSILVRR